MVRVRPFVLPHTDVHMWDRGLRTASVSALDINSVWQRPRRLSSTAAAAQELLNNIVVKVDEGQYTKFQGATFATDRTDLLTALKADDLFSADFKDVSPSRCIIAIVRTTSDVPTPADEAAATVLGPLETLNSAMAKASIGTDEAVFLHVRTSKAAANATPG